LTLHKAWRSAIENSFVRPLWERTAEVPLSEYRDSVARKPKAAARLHIINATINVPSSENPNWRRLEDGSLRILIRGAGGTTTPADIFFRPNA
jgi:hypothetical protein